MSDIQSIVTVFIDRQTRAVTQAGFGTPMILGTHKKFQEKIRYYSDLDSVLEDFSSTDYEYMAARDMLAQEPRPVQIAIGRRATDKAVITISAVPSFVYSITINGTIVTYTSGGSDTAADIAAALVALINAQSYPVTATDNTDGTIDIDPDVSGVAFSLDLGNNITLTSLTTINTIAEDLSSINDENSDWYGLILASRVKQDQLDAAAWVETQEKILGIASDEEDIKSVADSLDTTSIAAQIKSNNYERTYCVYHHRAGPTTTSTRQYADAAIMAKMFTYNPGAATWNFKGLSGIQVSDLTTTEQNNIFDKNANMFVRIAGLAMFRDGKMGSGEFIDIMRGVDWLTARLQEEIFFALANSPKIPYTNAGVTQITTRMARVLDLGVSRGLLADDPEYVITAPNVLDVLQTNRANRFLPDVKFTARLAGAIHKVEIRGTVTV